MHHCITDSDKDVIVNNKSLVLILVKIEIRQQWRIQDFPQGGAPTPKIAIIFRIFAENCMKMKEFGPQGGRASLAPPLDPPMVRTEIQVIN